MTKLLPTATIIALMAIPALAQETAPAPSPATPSATATAPASPADVRTSAGDISANKLINESVKNAANEQIGDVNDVMIASDGKVSAVIVGVGGFLGIGEKDVALPFNQLMFAKDENGKLAVSTSMTKEALQAAPEYVKPENRS